MKRFLCFLLFGAVLFSLAACSSGPVQGQVWAYDTLCTGKIWGGTDVLSVFERSAQEGQRLLTANGSKQFFASADGDSLSVSEDLYRILCQAQILYRETGGVFDLTVAPLSELWNVNSATQPPSEEAIASALDLVGWDQVVLSEDSLTFLKAGMGIDIGSVGKGYGADKTVLALQKAGAEGGVLSFGGNVALFGTKDGQPFRIGIRDPKDPAASLGTLSLTDVSVVTSGAYERYFDYEGKRYHHLLDGTTGYPRESDLLSVTVVCSDGAQADLLSTALWLMGEESGLALCENLKNTEDFLPFDVVFVTEDGRVRITSGLKDVFSLTGNGYCLEVL